MNKRRRTIFISIAVVLVVGVAVTIPLPDQPGMKPNGSIFDNVMVALGLRKTMSSKDACIANLKQIDGAKATWELEKRKQDTNNPTPSDLFVTNDFINDWPNIPAVIQPGHPR